MDLEEYIPIYTIREYFYCVRIPYFVYYHYDFSRDILFLKQGKAFHEVKQQNLRKRMLKNLYLPDYQKFENSFVVSHNYRIYGYVDIYLENEEEVIPVEIKIHSRGVKKGYVFQVLAYGVALAEMKKKSFRTGYLLYGKKAKLHKVIFQEAYENEFKNTISEMRKILEKDFLPPSSAQKTKCYICQYKNFCGDRDL